MARSILIIDDTVFMRRLLRDVLRREGYEVREATGGADGLDLFREMRPDLTLLDVAMPDMSGLDVLRRLIEADGCARVLVISAASTHEAAADALRAGARGYLAKPFQPARLVEAVRAALRPDGLSPRDPSPV